MNAPNSDDPERNETIVIGSGTARPEAENENCASADGFCVVNENVPGVVSKPFPEIVPTPSTLTAFEGRGRVIEELVRSNVNPSTDQKLGTDPEVNDHGAWKATPSPAVTNVAKSPSTSCTCGSPELGVIDRPCQPVTIVAVPADTVSRVTVPVNVMSPVTTAA